MTSASRPRLRPDLRAWTGWYNVWLRRMLLPLGRHLLAERLLEAGHHRSIPPGTGHRSRADPCGSGAADDSVCTA